MTENKNNVVKKVLSEARLWVLGALALIAKGVGAAAFDQYLPKQGPIQWIKSEPTQWAGAIILLGVGGFFRLTRLKANGLNIDEMFNYLYGKSPLFERLLADIHPPLYPVMIKPVLWLGIEFGTRILSVAAGVVFCFIVWRVAVKIFGPAVGILSLFFAVFSPPLIWVSRIGQSYQTQGALTALAFLFFLKLWENPTGKSLVLYIVFSAASLYCFYYAILPWLFFTVVSFIILIKNRVAGAYLITGNLISFAFFTPMVFSMIKASDSLGALFSQTPLVNNFFEVILNFFGLFLRFSPAVPFALLARFLSFHGALKIIGLFLTLIVVVFLLVFGILKGIRDGEKSKRKYQTFLFGFYGFVVIAALILNWIWRAPLEDHYLLFISIVTIPVAANACLWPKNKIIAGFFILLFFAGCLTIITKVENQFFEEHRDVVWLVEKLAKDNTLLAVVNYHLADPYKVYGKKKIDRLNLPGDLPGREILIRKQTFEIKSSDTDFIRDKLKGHDMIIVLASDTKSGGMDQRSLDLLKLWIGKLGFIAKERVFFKSRKGAKGDKDGTVVRFVKIPPPAISASLPAEQ